MVDSSARRGSISVTIPLASAHGDTPARTSRSTADHCISIRCSLMRSCLISDMFPSISGKHMKVFDKLALAAESLDKEKIA